MLAYAQIRAFNAVARERSFSKAAKALGISQPAVTAQVRRLEADHGTQLFDRGGGQGVRLTETGLRLFAVTRQLGDVEDAALAILRGDAGLDGVDFRIATASPQVFLPLLARVRRAYPRASMQVVLGSTGEVLERLLDRDVDIGLAPVEAEDDHRLRLMPFMSHGLALLTAAGDPLAGRPAVALEALHGAPFIMRSGPSMTQRRVDALAKSRRLRVRTVLTLGSREAVLEAVANGMGHALVLTGDVPPDPRVALVPVADDLPEVTEYVMWLASRDAVAAVRSFLSVAVPRVTA